MTRFLAAACLASVSIWAGCLDLAPSQPKEPPKPLPVPSLSGGLPTTEAMPAKPSGEVVPATADTAGTKGKGYGGGPITEPIHQYFRTQYRLVFLQIEKGVKDYKALNERFPASFEEFEREILKPANIRLPELPPGHSYVYDAQTGQLMVQRPGAG